MWVLTWPSRMVIVFYSGRDEGLIEAVQREGTDFVQFSHVRTSTKDAVDGYANHINNPRMPTRKLKRLERKWANFSLCVQPPSPIQVPAYRFSMSIFSHARKVAVFGGQHVAAGPGSTINLYQGQPVISTGKPTLRRTFRPF